MLHACRVREPAAPTSCHRIWTPIKYCENKQEPPLPPVILHSAAVCSRDPVTYWECSSWRKWGRKEQWQNCRDSGFWMLVRFPGQLCTVQSQEHTALRSPIRVFGTWWAVWEQVTLEMCLSSFSGITQHPGASLVIPSSFVMPTVALPFLFPFL